MKSVFRNIRICGWITYVLLLVVALSSASILSTYCYYLSWVECFVVFSSSLSLFMCKFGSLWRFFPVHWTFILVSGILMETPKQKKASQPSNSPTIRVHSRSCSLFIINAFHFKKCPSDRQQYNNKYFKFTSATHPGWIDGRFIYVVSLFYLYLLVGWMLLRPRGAGYWRGVLGLFIQPLCPASRQKKKPMAKRFVFTAKTERRSETLFGVCSTEW